MDLSHIAVLSAVTMAAATVMSLAGFGFGLVSMAFFPLFMPLIDANIMASLLAVPVILMNLIPLRRYLRLRTLLPIVIGTVVGTPVGIWGLVRLEERMLLIGLGVVILVALVVGEIAAKGKAREPSTPIALGAGLLGGAFGGAYSISGPPVTLYLTSVLDGKQELKANLLLYFLLQIGFRFALLVSGGMATFGHVKTAALLVLPLFGGIGIGMALFNRVSSRAMRRITQGLLVFSSAMLIIKAL
jgi:uncharacterized protein